jgi:hypothetical protein
MNPNRHLWTPITLVTLGVVLAWVGALMVSASPVGGRLAVFIGGAVALFGLFWFRRTLSQAELEVETREINVAKRETAVADDRRALDELRKKVQDEIEEQGVILDRRQQELTRKLAVWHEWMEFPEPVDLNPNVAPADSAGSNTLSLREASDKDRQLAQLLESESKLLFDNILRNKYSPSGAFQATIIRDDVYALINKVARIYRPDIKNPLTETSLEQLARAASRACLHFLTVLDGLPVKVQHYDVDNMYGWVKQGVKAYGMYQSARPYLPYINSAWYLTRFAMGSNPFTLVAWWAASEAVSRSASTVTTKFVHQRSLALLQDVVRVVGYEVASLYGPDIRRRDANWIYGVELTHLVSEFPLSRDSLEHALREVGMVQLLNEYDRIFLYRSLAMRKSARPEQYEASTCLTIAQRRAVATRLERFFATSIYGKTPKRVDAWRAGVEERLGVKVQVDALRPALAESTQREEALRSLAGFLVDVKQREPHHLAEVLRATQSAGGLDSDARDKLLGDLASNPPFFFEPPNIDPDGPIALAYLDDLIRLAVSIAPCDMPIEAFIDEVGAFLRRDLKELHKLADRIRAEVLASRSAPGVKLAKFSPAINRAVLWLLAPDEQLLFIYDGVTRRAGISTHATKTPGHELVVVGTTQRTMAIDADESPRIVWLADASTRIAADDGRLVAGGLLTGGTWLDAPPHGAATPVLHVRGQPMRRFESYFAPLMAARPAAT